MNTNIEKEYKVLLTEAQFNDLISIYCPGDFHRQINTYYDTLEGSIKMKQGAMRIRTIDNIHLFTLKIHKGNNLYEYETTVHSDSIHAFQQDDIANLLKDQQIVGELVQIAQLTTKRAIIDTGFAEVCFDISSYNGITDYEIEYEYKKPHDGLQEFQRILSHIHLSYEKNCISKIQRALRAL